MKGLPISDQTRRVVPKYAVCLRVSVVLFRTRLHISPVSGVMPAYARALCYNSRVAA